MLILWFFSFVLYAHTVTHSEGPSSSALTKSIRNNLYRNIKGSAQHVLPCVHTYVTVHHHCFIWWRQEGGEEWKPGEIKRCST